MKFGTGGPAHNAVHLWIWWKSVQGRAKAYGQRYRQYIYKRNIEARSRNYCWRGKAIRITHSECVSTDLSTKACLVILYFYTLSHKRHNFRIKNKVTEHKMCVSVICTTLASNISGLINNSAIYCQKCISVFM
jgi:hypothetical protein